MSTTESVIQGLLAANELEGQLRRHKMFEEAVKIKAVIPLLGLLGYDYLDDLQFESVSDILVCVGAGESDATARFFVEVKTPSKNLGALDQKRDEGSIRKYLEVVPVGMVTDGQRAVVRTRFGDSRLIEDVTTHGGFAKLCSLLSRNVVLRTAPGTLPPPGSSLTPADPLPPLRRPYEPILREERPDLRAHLAALRASGGSEEDIKIKLVLPILVALGYDPFRDLVFEVSGEGSGDAPDIAIADPSTECRGPKPTLCERFPFFVEVKSQAKDVLHLPPPDEERCDRYTRRFLGGLVTNGVQLRLLSEWDLRFSGGETCIDLLGARAGLGQDTTWAALANVLSKERLPGTLQRLRSLQSLGGQVNCDPALRAAVEALAKQVLSGPQPERWSAGKGNSPGVYARTNYVDMLLRRHIDDPRGAQRVQGILHVVHRIQGELPGVQFIVNWDADGASGVLRILYPWIDTEGKMTSFTKGGLVVNIKDYGGFTSPKANAANAAVAPADWQEYHSRLPAKKAGKHLVDSLEDAERVFDALRFLHARTWRG
ncbi:MAG: hypothetical protein HY721_15735 [Planctomycetes bacterium]|nr:hypothetical protein [Planctomycetota bacterium]